MLDGYDVSLLGWPHEHPLHQQAQQILQEHNPNQASSESHSCRMLALTPASKRKAVVMTRQHSWPAMAGISGAQHDAAASRRCPHLRRENAPLAASSTHADMMRALQPAFALCLQEKNSPDGLEGPARRFVQFGGGTSPQQLAWLQRQLEEALEQNQQCIVCCHLPLHPDTCELEYSMSQ